MTRLRRSRWLGPVVVGLCAFLVLGATIRKSSIIAGSTALIGGTASRVVVTDSSGNLTTSSILQHDGTNVTQTSGQYLSLAGGVVATAPQFSHASDANSGFGFLGADIPGIAASGSWMGRWESGAVSIRTLNVLRWTSGVNLDVQLVALIDVAAGGLEVNNGTAGTRSDLLVRNLHATGYLHAQTSFAVGAHVVTIGNDGVGTSRNTEVLGGARSYYIVDCLDPQGCAVHVSTAMRAAGAIVYLVATSANAVLVEDVADVQHVATAFDMGAADAMQFIFVRAHSGATWFSEVSRANN